MEYEGAVENFVVPAGFITDFATVPRFMRWLVGSYGPYTRAAILHDWLLVSEIPAKRITSRDADGIFRRVMKEEEVRFGLRWLMWAAVRVAALFNPRRSHGRQFWRDAPVALFIGVVALPYVGPASLLALLTLIPIRLLGPLLPVVVLAVECALLWRWLS